MKGLVRIEVIKHLKGKKERKTQFGHNMISNGGLANVMAEAMRGLMGASQFVGGSCRSRNSLWCGLNMVWTSGGSYYYRRTKVYQSKYGLSCALLGINDNAYASIDSRTGFLPLLDTDGTVDTDAVRALASLDTAATSSAGVSEKMNDASIIDTARVGNKYDFPGGTGTGTVSGVAMLPGTWKPGVVPKGGMIALKRMDDFSVFDDSIQGATKVVAPGLDGLGLEIRMQYTTADSVTSHIRNLGTGALTDGTAGDWFPPYAEYIPMYDDGTYVYAANVASGLSDQYVIKYLKTNKSSSSTIDLRLSNVSSSSSYDRFTKHGYYGFYNNNGSVYVIAGGLGYSYKARVGGAANASFTDKSTWASWISTNLGITIPSAWITDSDVVSFIPCTVGSYKALKLILKYGSPTNRDCTLFGTTWCDIYIFSDGSDPIGSLVDIIPMTSPESVLWSAGGKIGILERGYTRTDIMQQGVSDYGVGNHASALGINPGWAGESNFPETIANDSRFFVNNDSDGCWISMQGMWSTWLSVKQLEEDVSKTDTTDIKVEYDYTFSGTGTTPMSNS